jgi:protein TonB
MNDTSLQVNIPSVNHIDVDISGIGIGTGDGEYLPLVKIAPSYPFKAMAARIEGSCVVEYTVTQTGATKNIAIVKGECLRIFARSSIDAAKKFKYKPRIIDGIAIEVPNVYNRFDFRLEKEEEQND